MDFDRMEFELAVQDAVRAELAKVKKPRPRRPRRERRSRDRLYRRGRPWWFPFAVVALAVINTILWPVAFGAVFGIIVGLFLLIQPFLVK